MLNRDCENFKLNVAPYLYGELPEDEKALLEAHLGECRDCHEQLQEFKDTLAIVDEAARQNDVLLPDGFISDRILSEGLLASHHQEHIGRRKVFYFMSMAASFFFGIVASYAMLNCFSTQNGSGGISSSIRPPKPVIIIYREMTEEEFQTCLTSLDENNVTVSIRQVSGMGYSPEILKPMLLKAMIVGKNVHIQSHRVKKPDSVDILEMNEKTAKNNAMIGLA